MSLGHKWFLDTAARLASLAKNGNVKASALSNIQEVLLSEGDDRSCLLYAIAFVLRQAGRKVIPYWTAKEFASAFHEMYKNNLTRNEAIRFIGLVRWIFEALPQRSRVSNFDDFIKTSIR